MQPKSSDPVIDEIREIRHQISARCEHDAAKLIAYYMEFQNQYRDRLLKSEKQVECADSTVKSGAIDPHPPHDLSTAHTQSPL